MAKLHGKVDVALLATAYGRRPPRRVTRSAMPSLTEAVRRVSSDERARRDRESVMATSKS